MAKYVIEIRLVETYSHSVIVEAKNQTEAVAKIEQEWNKSDYLYEKTTDCCDDMSTKFVRRGKATKHDENIYREI